MPFQLNTMLDSAMAGWAASHGGCTARSKLVEQAAIHFAEEGDRRGVMLALRHLFFDAAETRRGGGGRRQGAALGGRGAEASVLHRPPVLESRRRQAWIAKPVQACNHDNRSLSFDNTRAYHRKDVRLTLS
jgi:hypothetical protein